jgi:hypothetical protein
MSNRAQRRRDTREFRHQVRRGPIVTHLTGAETDLSDFPMLAKIAAAWRASIPQRKPWCFACEASFAEAATPGAFLFATPPGATDTASISGLCATCWGALPDDEVERACERVLTSLLPNGRFLDQHLRNSEHVPNLPAHWPTHPSR